MANNELFYRAARDGLGDGSTIQGLVDDLDTAIESYLVGCDEEGELTTTREDVKHGYQHAVALADNLRAWMESTR